MWLTTNCSEWRIQRGSKFSWVTKDIDITGFQLEGNDRIRCFEGGVWSDVGRCLPQIRCYNVPQIGNSNISSGNDQVQSSRNISCHPGYEIIGPNKIYCLASGEWTAPGFCQKSKFHLQSLMFVFLKGNRSFM